MVNYQEYVVSEPGKSSTAYNATSTTATGFLEFKPRDMNTQAKYDAIYDFVPGITIYAPSQLSIESSL